MLFSIDILAPPVRLGICALALAAAFLMQCLFLYRHIKHHIHTFINEATEFSEKTLNKQICSVSPMIWSETDTLSTHIHQAGATLRDLYHHRYIWTEFLIDIVLIQDHNKVITGINKAACERLNVTPSEAIGRPLSRFFTQADAQRILDTIQHADDLPLKSEELFLMRYRTGETFPVRVYGFQAKNDTAEETVILCRDMTPVIDAEKKFNTFFQSDAAMMCISTLEDGRFVAANALALSALGYDRIKLMGKTVSEVSVFADPDWRDRMLQMLSEKGRIRNMEVEFKTQNGDSRYCLASIDRIKIGHTFYLLTIANDISDRIQYESDLMSAKESAVAARTQLESTLRELERFNNLMINREERILAIKAEVNTLLKALGRPARYTAIASAMEPDRTADLRKQVRSGTDERPTP